MNEPNSRAVGGPLDGSVRRVVCAAIRADDGTLLLGVRAVIAALGLGACITAGAQAPGAAVPFPTKQVRLVVPFPPGGSNDILGRFLAQRLGERLGQTVIVENKPGASGNIGAGMVAKAKPDGYTIGLITVEIGMMHWQGLTDLKGTSYTPIGLVNADPAGLQVRSDSPYKTVKDLVDAIKANPGKLKASGTGQGGIWHLAIAGMLRDLKLDPAAVPWVPSNGAAPGLTDLVAGGVEFVPCSLPEARSRSHSSTSFLSSASLVSMCLPSSAAFCLPTLRADSRLCTPMNINISNPITILVHQELSVPLNWINV
mgnify:CR=1 FL=1